MMTDLYPLGEKITPQIKMPPICATPPTFGTVRIHIKIFKIKSSLQQRILMNVFSAASRFSPALIE